MNNACHWPPLQKLKLKHNFTKVHLISFRWDEMGFEHFYMCQLLWTRKAKEEAERAERDRFDEDPLGLRIGLQILAKLSNSKF